ncbi:MAG: EthD domain-containing protein [Rhodospirillaceae bacterium]|nr:EthD domain-containing protein [Rhodospirillaceae bacterium]
MFKIVFCLRWRPDLTPEQFDSYWRDTHAPLVRRHAAALGIRRYVQSTRFESDLAAVAAKVRNAPAPFDGVAELWFDSREAMQAGFSAAAGRAAGRELLEDEARFIDLENSPIWFATEREIVGGGA